MTHALSGSAYSSPAKQPFVAVPSHNHARFIQRCLRSILNQSLKPSALLVIDDGSTDDSAKLIEETLLDCSFPCELVVQPNRGLSATLNHALKRSHGDYFAYLGSDDLWLTPFLEARIATLEERPGAVLAYGNAFSIDGSDRVIDCTTDWATYVDGDVRQMLMTTLAPLSPTVVYRRHALERYGWNEKSKLEDYELYLRLSGDGDFAFSEEVLSAWRIHGQNASLNVSMMMHEKLEAQRRVGPHLGFTPDEIKKFQSLTMFRTAQEYMRRSEKTAAMRLMFRHLDGMNSWTEGARMIAGLAAPRSLLQWHKSRRQTKAARQYGSIAI